MTEEPAARDADVDPLLADELPGLRMRTLVVTARGRRTPRGLRQRLRDLGQRLSGPQAIALRARPVPQAYRVLYRQIGLDPDTDRPPGEQAVVDRLVRGRFDTGDRIRDALLLALVETGVPLLAFDAATLTGEPALRPARAGELLPAGEHAHELPAGRLVLADQAGPIAELFGRHSTRHEPGRFTEHVRLVAVQAPGVPGIHVDEALWLAAEALSED